MSSEEHIKNSGEEGIKEEKKPLSPLDKQLNLLKSRDFRKKNDAIKVLGKMKENQAREALYKIARESEWDERLRTSAIDALGRSGRDQAFFKLLQDLAGDEKQGKEIRRTCITHLTRFRDPKTLKIFTNALDDSYRFIRFWAVRGLIKLQDPKSDIILVKALGDEDEEIRKEVNAHLERIGENIVPALIKAYHDTNANKFTRYGVMGLLGRITTSKSVETLIEALHDENDRVVTIAIRGLGKSNSPDAITPLLALYKINENRRRLIEDSLYRIGQDQENQKILVYILSSVLLDEEPAIPALALSIFKKFPNSYIYLGDIANDKDTNENICAKIKELQKYL